MRCLLVTVSALWTAAVVAAAEAPAAEAPVPAQPAAAAPASEEGGVRNPFWPIGYEGRRERITAEVRIVPKKREEIERERAAAKAAEEAAARKAADAEAAKKAAAELAAKKAAEEAEKAKIITAEHWMQARAALRIGGRVRARTEDGAEQRLSVLINGNTYVDGDLVSFNHGINRFTWRVTGLTEGGKLKLVRVKARNLDEKSAKIQDGNTGKGDKK